MFVGPEWKIFEKSTPKRLHVKVPQLVYVACMGATYGNLRHNLFLPDSPKKNYLGQKMCRGIRACCAQPGSLLLDIFF